MKRMTFSKAFTYILLVIVGFVSVFPFYYMVTASTNVSVEVVRGRMFFGKNLFNNLKNLMDTIPIGMGIVNSLRNTFLGTFGSLLICSMAGYGFTIYRSKARDRLMSILLLSMMIPFASIMVPLFRLTASLKLLNTTAGIILPGLSSAFLIFFFRQSSQSFPMEIVQAARVDGLNEIGIFFRIYLPIMPPTLAAAGIVSFMGGWNSYLWPLIILQKESSKTLPILITQLTSGYVTDYGMQMLAITISVIPTILLFVTQQRRFVEGITGSVK